MLYVLVTSKVMVLVILISLVLLSSPCNIMKEKKRKTNDPYVYSSAVEIMQLQ